MKNSFLVLYLVIPFVLSQDYDPEEDEEPPRTNTEASRFICQGKEDQWEFCKECESRRTENCELKLSSECRCRNIVVIGEGGSDCNSTDNGKKWCYVDGHSPCSDKIPKSTDFQALDFFNDENGLYSSFMACEDFNESAFEEISEATGNEEFLEDIELNSDDDLGEEFGGSGFLMENPENCQAECAARPVCYGWTFNQVNEETGNGTCTLKNSPICCNQSSKKIRKAGATSGFNCRKSQGKAPYCWSTHSGCECNQNPGDGSSYEFCSGCHELSDASSAGAIGSIVKEELWNRKVFRLIRGKWRLVKQKSND